MSEVIAISSKAPEIEDIDRVVEYLRQGQVICYPTETIYGLGADVLNKRAVKRIYDLKSRDYGLPISILVSDFKMMREFVAEVPERALSLMRKYWPGPMTICLPASQKLPKGLLSNTNKVGIRISSHPIAAAIVERFGSPVTTTSANLTDFPPSLNVKHVQKYFGVKIPCIVDGGECDPSKGSTVIDIGEDTMRIIREGAVPADEVIKCFQG